MAPEPGEVLWLLGKSHNLKKVLQNKILQKIICIKKTISTNDNWKYVIDKRIFKSVSEDCNLLTLR